MKKSKSLANNREVAAARKRSNGKTTTSAPQKKVSKKKKKVVAEGKNGKKSVDKMIAASVDAYLKLSDDNRRDWSFVQNIIHEASPCYGHRVGPDGRIYGGEVVSLTPDQSVKVKTFRVNDVDGERIGFNRTTKPKKLRQIMKCLLTRSSSPNQLSGTTDSAVYAFSPPFVARIFNPDTKAWELNDLDGQHRRHAHLLCGLPVRIFVVDMDLDTARYNFILHNTMQTKVDRKTKVMGSSNPTATEIRRLSDTYGTSIEQADRLICGLVSVQSVSSIDLVHKNASLDDAVIARADAFFEVWTQNRRWISQSVVPKKDLRKSSNIYSGTAVLQAMGWAIKDRPGMSISSIKSKVGEISGQENLWYPSGALNKVYDSHQGGIKDIYDILDKRWKSLE